MNPSQREAVCFHDGALLLLAGPGSGKTFVVTHRVQALIASGVKASEILVITFTRAAALEMQERFFNLVYPDEPAVSFGTFHAIFYSIIKHHHQYRKVVPITDKEKLNMCKRALEETGHGEMLSDFEECIALLGLIGSCKNNGNDPFEFDQNMLEKAEFARIFEAYNDLLRSFDRIDFDDMVNLCLELLKREPEFAAVWQNKFKYILIDEFQDISANQYELVKLLAYPQDNVFAVGDDDQSIYAFRGADVSLMRSFEKDFTGAQVRYLSVNYRSSGSIVDFAGRVIRSNKNRFSKNISAEKETGDSVTITGAADMAAQNEMVLDVIKNAHMGGTQWSDIAILLRTNRQAGVYAALLRQAGIPCDIKETKPPFSTQEIKDICAYLALGAGDNSREKYSRIINKPVRYIKRAAMPEETVDISQLRSYYRGDTYMIKRIDELDKHIRRLKGMRPHLAVRYICTTVGYDRYVRESAGVKAFQDYLEQRDAFTALIKDLDTYRQVAEMLDDIRMSYTESHPQDTVVNGVRIQTYHSSKGLEYDTVILPDVNEGKIPSKSAKTEADIEEERRMFYVAVTRAAAHLHIFYRKDGNLRPSRFVSPGRFC